MTKFITAALAAAILAVPAVATAGDAPAKRSFTRDGETYVYTATQKNGRTVLSGRRFPSGNAFDLVVIGDKVSGTSAGSPVSFVVANPVKGSTELASR